MSTLTTDHPPKCAIRAAALIVVLIATMRDSAAASQPKPHEGRSPSELPHKVIDQVPPDLMLQYFRRLSAGLPPNHQPAADLDQWQRRRLELRAQIWEMLGNFPLDQRPPLRPKLTGRIDHSDHVVEKVLYESLPGLYVTALLYKPKDRPGRLPAVICTNGHWPLAKAMPLIQERCAGLARMGVVAFCQDVIGTGERQSYQGDPPQNYHGFYRGAAPQLVDRTLLGYVLYECIRACDYLVSRDDIDPGRIFCTGASGGGKQSMFLPALDDRLAGAVPVCYISSYQDHMGATACVGEIPPGVLRRTNQWELLALHAPRPLLCIAANRDVPVFLPAPMLSTLARTRQIYRLYGAEELLRSATVDSGHDYNRPMREILYGQIAHHLLGRPGETIHEPNDLPVEPESVLRVGLPPSETLQSLTYQRGRELAASRTPPANLETWRQARQALQQQLTRTVLGDGNGAPRLAEAAPPQLVRRLEHRGCPVEHWVLQPEPGLLLPLVVCFPKSEVASAPAPLAIVVDEQGKSEAIERGLVEKLVDSGWVVAAFDYRGAGETAGTVPQIGYGPGTPEYNLCNYSLLVGRPLTGMRVEDVRSAVDFLCRQPHVDPARVALVGRGRGALVDLLATALDDRIRWLVAEELLATWVFPEEFVGIGLSYFIPRILTVADIPEILAAAAPRAVLIINPVDGRRRPLEAHLTQKQHESARAVYSLYDEAARPEYLNRDLDETAAAMTEWLDRQRKALAEGAERGIP